MIVADSSASPVRQISRLGSHCCKESVRKTMYLLLGQETDAQCPQHSCSRDHLLQAVKSIGSPVRGRLQAQTTLTRPSRETADGERPASHCFADATAAASARRHSPPCAVILRSVLGAAPAACSLAVPETATAVALAVAEQWDFQLLVACADTCPSLTH